jgi:Flp pilus assembly pilin Flp
MKVAEVTGLRELMRRFATDEAFRSQVLLTPRETLATELGISRETYGALIAVIPVLLVGGLAAVSGEVPIDTDTWGGWGGH